MLSVVLWSLAKLKRRKMEVVSAAITRMLEILDTFRPHPLVTPCLATVISQCLIV